MYYFCKSPQGLKYQVQVLHLILVLLCIIWKVN